MAAVLTALNRSGFLARPLFLQATSKEGPMNLRAGFWKEGCLRLGHVGLKGSKLSDPSTTRPTGSEATEQSLIS
jgi:hypothetical protein